MALPKKRHLAQELSWRQFLRQPPDHSGVYLDHWIWEVVNGEEPPTLQFSSLLITEHCRIVEADRMTTRTQARAVSVGPLEDPMISRREVDTDFSDHHSLQGVLDLFVV